MVCRVHTYHVESHVSNFSNKMAHVMQVELPPACAHVFRLIKATNEKIISGNIINQDFGI